MGMKAIKVILLVVILLLVAGLAVYLLTAARTTATTATTAAPITATTPTTGTTASTPTASTTATTPTASAPPFVPTDTLVNGQWLYQDGTNTVTAYLQSLTVRIGLQADGNMVATCLATGKVLWASGTVGAVLPIKLIMQPDNNVVLYSSAQNNSTVGSAAGKAVWASNTSGRGATGQAYFRVGADSAIFCQAGPTVLWSVGARC